MSRYDRAATLYPNGHPDQEKLRAARVLIVGSGGLAASVLPLLVGAGCGEITLMDHDCVEMHNLHRQTIFREQDVGQNKALIAAQRLQTLNRDCRLIAIPQAWSPGTTAVDTTGYDVILDAADSVAVTYGLSDRCKLFNLAFISASVSARQGYVGGFCKNAPSYRAVFPNLPDRVMTCADAGVSGPVVTALGALQAEMALNILLEIRPSPLGLLFRFDAKSWTSTSFRFDTAPEPDPVFPPFIGISELRARDRIYILNALNIEIPPGLATPQNIDLNTLPPPPVADRADQRSVFICRRGITAWRAAEAYIAQTGDTSVAIAAAG